MQKSKFLLWILVLLPVFLAGCMNPAAHRNNPGDLKVAIQIPDELLEKVKPQFVDYEIILSSITVKITQNETVHTQTAPVEGKIVSVVFEGLREGEWNVEVVATDVNGYDVFAGTGIGLVEKNVLTPVFITLNMLPGDLNLQVIFPSDWDVAYANVTLIHLLNPDLNITKSLELNGNCGMASFLQIIASTWPIEVQLFNAQNEVVGSGRSQVDVLPGRVTFVQLELDSSVEGGMNIIIGWDLGLSAPTGLVASMDGSSVILTWDAITEGNIAGYAVYRSTSLDGTKFLLNTSVVVDPAYTDASVESGVTYWYWVQAYGLFGFCSYLSSPVSITPDFALNKIVFKSYRNGNTDIYSIHPDGSNLTQLTTWGWADSRPKWSPDGTRIAYISYRNNAEQLMVMNADGSNPVQLTFDTEGLKGTPVWSPDGTKIAYEQLLSSNTWDLFVIQADGSGLTQLTNQSGSDRNLAWSPMGDRISYSSDTNGLFELWVMNADGTGKTCLTNSGHLEDGGVWSHDGTRIAFTRTIAGNDDIYVINADGSNLTQITSGETDDTSPVWSPDDNRIAFRSNRNGNYNIFVMDADGLNQTALTFQNTGFDLLPVWSPDGTQILFSSDRDGNEELYVIGADGSGETNITNYSESDTEYDWSPF